MSYASDHASGIGCGEIAAVLGLDPRRRPIDVWAVKRGLVEADDEGDATTERGNALERAVIEWAIRNHPEPDLGYGVEFPRQSGKPEGYEVPIQRGVLIGTPDAGKPVYGDGEVVSWRFGVEAKTRASAFGWGESGTDEIPPDVRAQVEGYLALTGAPVWYVPVLFGVPALTFRIYVVRRDPARSERLIARLESWWRRHVVEGHPPEVSEVERSRLARLSNPKAGKVVIQSSAKEVIALMERRRAAEERRSEAQAALEAAEDEWRAVGGLIEELIGSAAGIETPVGSAFLNARSSRGKLVTKWPN
jgi:predicted phage-related endonuclease